jgi:hypothetical protein
MRNLRQFGLLAAILCLLATVAGGAKAQGAGTLVGSPAYATSSSISNTDNAGSFGEAITFNGTSQYVTVPGSTFAFVGGIGTAECRVRTTSASGTQVFMSYSTDEALTTGGSWYIGISSSGKVIAVVDGFDSGTSFGGTATINDGVWHHVALVMTGGTSATLYVDGAAAGSATGTYNAGTTKFYSTIGSLEYSNTATPVYGFYFAGSLDEAVMWSTAKYSTTFTPATAPYTSGTTGLVGLYHFDGDANDSSASSPSTFAYSNAAFSYSPDNWYQGGSYAQADSAGADVDVNFTGTTFSATFDTSPLTTASIAAPSTSSPAAMSVLPSVASDPVLVCYIDNGPAIYAQEASTVAFATGLASGSHTARIMVAETDYDVDGWNTPVIDPRFTGLVLDSGASVSVPTEPSGTAIAFGDSILEGLRTLGINNSYTDQDASLSWIWPVEQLFGVRLGVIGYGDTNFNMAGQRNVPGLITAYALHDANHSRLVSGHFAQVPNYVFCENGVNGTPAQSDVTTTLEAIATAAPGAKLVQIGPFAGTNYSTVKAGTLAAGWLFADTAGSAGIPGLTTLTGNPTRLSSGGLHPLAPLGSIETSGVAMAAIEEALSPATSITTFQPRRGR